MTTAGAAGAQVGADISFGVHAAGGADRALHPERRTRAGRLLGRPSTAPDAAVRVTSACSSSCDDNASRQSIYNASGAAGVARATVHC